MSKIVKLDSFKYNADTDTNMEDLIDTSILSKEQLLAFDRYKKGENIFLTGPGGTGKTKLIQYFVQYSLIQGSKFQVCAMTGCAAILLNCSARTLHSWSGIKLAKGTKDEVIENVLRNKSAVKNWKKCKILILDEISMLSKKLFEIIEEIPRIIKKVDAPFGGMQIVFSGDFCQLPPIGSPGEKDTYTFCFQSPKWHVVFPMYNHILLKKIFRQDDIEYARILKNLRKGVITINDYSIIQQRISLEYDSSKHNDCVPTKLFPLRTQADYVNNRKFAEIKENENVFTVVEKDDNETYDNGKAIPSNIFEACRKLTNKEKEFEIKQLITNSPCVQILRLKKGAAVMCIINLDMDNDICNGSQGIVLDIIKDGENSIPYILVKFSNGTIKKIYPHNWQSDDYPTISISQYPLCLAWALTIHKIQGATLDMAEIDVGNTVFEYGQTYVALSRVKSLNGLYLSAFNPEKVQTNPIVKEFYDNIEKKSYQVFLEKEVEIENKDIKKIVL